ASLTARSWTVSRGVQTATRETSIDRHPRQAPLTALFASATLAAGGSAILNLSSAASSHRRIGVVLGEVSPYNVDRVGCDMHCGATSTKGSEVKHDGRLLPEGQEEG